MRDAHAEGNERSRDSDETARVSDETARLGEELARRDVGPSMIDELTDHFATTVEARLGAGDTLDEAIATAWARLGDLGALAREHAKVASPFGTRPPRSVAWIVAAAMLVWPWLVLVHQQRGWVPLEHVLMLYGLSFGILRTLAIAGLAFRVPQGAALVQGIAACELLLIVANLDFPSLASNLRITTLALLTIPACSCLLLATRFTVWRWTMVALGFSVPIGMFGVGDSLNEPIPILWLLAATTVALRARGAALACGVLTLVVLLKSGESLSYVIHLIEGVGFQRWHAIDIATVATAAAGSVLTTVVALRCNRPWSAIVDELRPRRAPDAPA
jgi:hypothetical protein